MHGYLPLGLTPVCPNPTELEQHLNQFGRFCTAHIRDQHTDRRFMWPITPKEYGGSKFFLRKFSSENI